jgi:hypothetical protein
MICFSRSSRPSEKEQQVLQTVFWDIRANCCVNSSEMIEWLERNVTTC